VQFFVVLEKFTCACLFQIALEIIRLPIQIALALRARAILLAFEKFTRAHLFQIALEIM